MSVLILSFCPLGVHAAEIPAQETFAGLMAVALEHHPQWSALQAEYDALHIVRSRATRWDLPELYGDVGQKTLRQQGDDGLVYSIGLEQAFPAPGKMMLRDEIARLELEKMELAMHQFKTELEYGILSAVHEWHVSHAYQDLVEKQAAQLRQMLQPYLDRQPAGIPQRLERQIIETAVLDLEKSGLDARRETERLLAELNSKLGRGPGDPLSITGLPPMDGVDRSRTPSFRNHPNVLLRNLDMKRREAEARQTVVESRPELAAGPYYSEESVGDDDEYTVGVAFSLPLPLWRRSDGAAALAQAGSRQAQADAEIITRMLAAQWHDWVQEASHHEAVLEVFSGDKLKSMQEAAELAAQQFLAGAVTVPLFLEMQRDFLAAATTHHQAMAGLNRANRHLSIMQSFEEESNEE